MCPGVPVALADPQHPAQADSEDSAIPPASRSTTDRCGTLLNFIDLELRVAGVFCSSYVLRYWDLWIDRFV